ncbi:DUF4163 domain-containing protein [Allopontixanthobacter sp.]|uniref:DUF4163 domain-containing protein n=1 Tax=Allopontixanthobacter sp. TaxID=2906452 RepID=UPI002ABBCB47|nr:DUF4163 domain-containing protein [Allopontixanthobacter sp.]MDZ4307403.1 DUF4163 domain-containing protein [Allopontixanthobacter sp.]
MSRPLVVQACVTATLLTLAACSPASEAHRSQEAGSSATAAARASTAEGVSVEEENDLYSYKFAYPAAVGAIPPLAREIERRADAAKSEMRANAEAERKLTAEEGFPYRQQSLLAEWKVAANLPDWLSLTYEFATYTGGAHGIYGVTSLVWDKQTGRAMEGVEMFVSPAALTSAVAATYCPALDRQRKQRNAGAPDDQSGTFGQCPEVTQLTVIPGSSNGRTLDRIGLYAGPYVAGSYADGSYEVTLPVDAQVLAAVKPKYRAAFSAVR